MTHDEWTGQIFQAAYAAQQGRMAEVHRLAHLLELGEQAGAHIAAMLGSAPDEVSTDRAVPPVGMPEEQQPEAPAQGADAGGEPDTTFQAFRE